MKDPASHAISSNEAGRPRFYRPELDVLRFFAFFMVFIYHIPYTTEGLLAMNASPTVIRWFQGLTEAGSFGVDVFFALSAFLITELLVREKQATGTVAVRAFYIRRILRIWPLYFFFLGLGLLLTTVTRSQHIPPGAVLAYSFLAGNWWVVFWGNPASIIYPLWTVSVEEQFYILWPPILRKLRGKGLAIAACTMLIIATATRILLVVRHATAESFWCNSFTRLDSIAVGILIAFWLKGSVPGWGSVLRRWMFVAVLLLLVATSMFLSIERTPVPAVNALLGYPLVALGAGLMLTATLSPAPIYGRNVLVYLGKISYGLYVFHALAYAVAFKLLHGSMNTLPGLVATVALAFFITVACAALSYKFLESPFLRRKNQFAKILTRPV